MGKFAWPGRTDVELLLSSKAGRGLGPWYWRENNLYRRRRAGTGPDRRQVAGEDATFGLHWRGFYLNSSGG